MCFCIALSSCSAYNAGLRVPTINDGKIYGRVPLGDSQSQPYIHKRTTSNINLPPLDQWASQKAAKKYNNVEAFLEDNATTALLVIRNDSILYEQYFNGYTDTTITQVFSITKPLIASFLSKALEEGKIDSLETQVSNFYPIRKKEKKCELLTLKHLGQMQSGFNQYDYLRVVKVLKLYYAKDVDAFISKARVGKTPGEKFKYKSFDTQLLGTCLENIFEEKDLLNRFKTTYWDKIGPEHKAYFSIDDPSSGNLKYYGGLNISARDLAKIGKIYLNNGKFEDEQVISEDWVNYVEDTTNHVGKWDYCMGWYFDSYSADERVYYGSGLNGQFLMLNKENNTIVVRLGTSKSKQEWWKILWKFSTLF